MGCCDSSPRRHATAHFHGIGHPIVRSYEPGEDWYWCYVDDVMFELDGAPPAPIRIPDPVADRRHARLRSRGGASVVTDVQQAARETGAVQVVDWLEHNFDGKVVRPAAAAPMAAQLGHRRRRRLGHRQDLRAG